MKRVRLRKVYLKNELKQQKQLIIINETFVLVFLRNRKGFILKTLIYNLYEKTKNFGKILYLFFQIKSERENHTCRQ